MTIQEFIQQDPRVQEMQKTGKALTQRKNALIMEISHIEADIIKLMGQFETIQKEIISKVQDAMQQPKTTDTVPVEVPPEPVKSEGEPEIAEENIDDGFAEAGLENSADFQEPSAENVNPLNEE